ncbi:MAG: hypothetical protein OEQ29_10580 [Alphaproteobacteria bacterium]|nr:hypothetical protein [Alphaproteobacteria bacterium]
MNAGPARLVLGSALGAVLVTAVANGAGAASKLIDTPQFTIRYEGISDKQAKAFAAKTKRALADVTGYFGSAIARKFSVVINDRSDQVGIIRAEWQITIPADRIRGDAGGPPPIRGRGPAIVHDITDLLFPSQNKVFGPLLTIGLGVYLQEKFGGRDRVYPNMGKDLHDEAVRLSINYQKMIAVKNLEAVRTRRGVGRPRRVAMTLEGSFVRYLIESSGKTKFLKLYRGEPISTIYGKAERLCSLEERWVRYLAESHPGLQSKDHAKLVAAPAPLKLAIRRDPCP